MWGIIRPIRANVLKIKKILFLQAPYLNTSHQDSGWLAYHVVEIIPRSNNEYGAKVRSDENRILMKAVFRSKMIIAPGILVVLLTKIC